MKNQNCDLKQAVKDLKDEYGDLIRQVKVSKLPPFFKRDHPPIKLTFHCRKGGFIKGGLLYYDMSSSSRLNRLFI
jgi:hypothetical protein